jgi:hypothetical protein
MKGKACDGRGESSESEKRRRGGSGKRSDDSGERKIG